MGKGEENESDEAGKIFVGGLSWETTQEKLQEYFSQYGEVVDCVVMKNNETGKSRGFGFVTFKDIACVGKVLSSGPHTVDNRTIDPKICSSRDTQQGKKSGQFPKVFLGGLPTNCTETDIRSFFSRYGTVVEVVLMYDQEKKKARGFGFLSFETEDSVKQVCAEHFVKINGKKIECKHAEPREKKRPPQSNNTNNNQWNAPQMGQSWGSGQPAPGPGPCGPGMGPAGPMPGPMPGPMGPPMNPGMMGPGYQGGWGGPPPYMPQGGWGPQPGAYGPGNGGWGWGYGAPYGGPPGPHPYGQPAYGYGYGNYGGYGGGPMGGPPPPNPPAPGTENFPSGNNASAAPSGGNNTAPGAPAAGIKSEGMGTYQQDASNYGPQRGYGPGPNNYNPGTNFNGQQANYGPPQVDASGNRPAGPGYHPYRR